MKLKEVVHNGVKLLIIGLVVGLALWAFALYWYNEGYCSGYDKGYTDGCLNVHQELPDNPLNYYRPYISKIQSISLHMLQMQLRSSFYQNELDGFVPLFVPYEKHIRKLMPEQLDKGTLYWVPKGDLD